MSNSFERHYEFRRELFTSVCRDLIGPDDPLNTELIDDAPITRYISGILYPQIGDAIDSAEDIDSQDEDDETWAADPPVALANVKYPSSMALSFSADGVSESAVAVLVTAARYTKVDDGTQRRRLRGAMGIVEQWRRVPITPEPVAVDIRHPQPLGRVELSDGLVLFYRVRPADSAGIVAVTVGLINSRRSGLGARDADCFLQPKILIKGHSNPTTFVERASQRLSIEDEDIESYRLLYRRSVSFATGHGCSAEWCVSAEDYTRASQVWSTFAPQYDLPLADVNPDIASISMTTLSEGSVTEVQRTLNTLLSGYRGWIRGEKQRSTALPAELQAAARRHLAECTSTADRIEKGIALLASDATVFQAFQVANQAMRHQRARTEWIKGGKATPSPELNRPAWRPFQLAFFLLCIRGIATKDAAERDIADLLWFPTGGGKTEAYLGVIAFTIFLRRLLHGPSGGGVTALMRYTLRLLTIQQFERAALLICCCEEIRQKQNISGGPIRIGLWVGRGATPNNLQEAREALNALRQGRVPSEQNPVQLRACPWCGSSLDHTNYFIHRDKRLSIACRTSQCHFATELPVLVVDEDIYSLKPSLIIATVDKFAALPWSEHTADLFNLNDPAVPPPELIVQDELHLISGPLGTLAGLYETAIEAICASKGLRPKVIASTATIRRASSQVKQLFNRSVCQFPPPGLDAGNSYFAVEAGKDRKASRMYVGFMAPGTSQSTLMIRAYASLLHYAAVLPGDPKVRDAYWTLVGYFNSLRVLAGAKLQVQDDVRDRLEVLARESGCDPRPIDEQIEMTSRESSAEIPNHLKRMAFEYPRQDALDFILATNMISVGVDIDRLGLMAVMGQPQSTSEYIQATSRVGRQWPGLAVVLFNSARSRDRSHYESFVTYHSALYRQVESTSVTPFSPRARDRGLHAVLIAFARVLEQDFRSNGSAVQVSRSLPAIQRFIDLILQRVNDIAPEEYEPTNDQLECVLAKWVSAASENTGLVFTNPFHPERALLIDAGRDDVDLTNKFSTLRSLRDVDLSSNLFMI